MLMLTTILPSVVLILLLCLDVGLVESTVVKDTYPDCAELVEMGACRNDRETMVKLCHKSCTDWERNREKYNEFKVDDDSFFDLSATTNTGDILDFGRFNGYVTMVINMAKLCKNIQPDPESYFTHMEELHTVWPYSLELIVFPFEHPNMDYPNEDCEDFEAAAQKTGRKVHVMEMAKINGSEEEVHPVYRYLKGRAKIEDLEVDLATFFVVNPEGTRVEVHQGTSLVNLKRYIHRMFEYEL